MQRAGGVAGAAALALAAQAGAALACGPMVTVRFMEGAPRDRVEITNNSSDQWQVARVALDLEGSAGALIFDTEPGGPGTSMHQPFRAGPSDIEAVVPPDVADGDRTLALDFAGFGPGARFTFTIDLDDTLPASPDGPMRVTDSEIDGALAQALFRHPDGDAMALEGHFGPDGIAIVSGLACS